MTKFRMILGGSTIGRKGLWSSGLALAALLVLARMSPAAPVTFQFDKAHSSPTFTVRHVFTMVPGRFNDFTGTIQFDEQDPEKSTVEVTIQTASISTDNERRDTHLKSQDFFNAEKNPTITFKSTKIEKGTDKDTYKVTGDLTMAGVTKPVVLAVQMLGMGPDPFNPKGMRMGCVATTTINRSDFGITWNKALDKTTNLLGDDVKVSFSVEAASQ